MRTRNVLAITALGAALAVSGCSSQAGSTAATAASNAVSSAVSTASAAVSSAASAAASQASSAVSAAVNKVDANTASKEELENALKNAGVANANKWAEEIEEYRPYTAENLSSKLTQELGKYNVDQPTLAQILSVLRA